MIERFTNLLIYETGAWTIVRHFLDNPLRNFNYVLINKTAKVGLSIDPVDIEFNAYALQHYGVELKAILLTHEHADHVQGTYELVVRYPQVEVYGPKGIEQYLDANLSERINHVWNDQLVAINGINFQVLGLPGHTLMHVGYFINDETPILVSGDTVFALGVGHCKAGGDVEALYNTIGHIRTHFDDDKTIYLPGHDLLESNLSFSQQFNWNTGDSKHELNVTAEARPLRTISDECRQNVFFNSDKKEIAEIDTGNALTDAQTVFISLREQRDNW